MKTTCAHACWTRCGTHSHGVPRHTVLCCIYLDAIAKRMVAVLVHFSWDAAYVILGECCVLKIRSLIRSLAWSYAKRHRTVCAEVNVAAFRGIYFACISIQRTLIEPHLPDEQVQVTRVSKCRRPWSPLEIGPSQFKAAATWQS